MVAFGVILYGFSIFVTDDAAGSDFSKTVLSLAYGGSVVAGGVLAIPLGLRADRTGVRGIVALGGLLAGSGMAVFATATQPWHVLAAWWFLIGPAGAMTFYEVAFVAVDQWCLPQHRPRVLGALTLIGGLAGIIFIPLTEWAVDIAGWRTAAFAMGSLVMVTALATAGLALRDVPRPQPTSSVLRARGGIAQLGRDRRFLVHTTAMVLTFFAAQGTIAHRIALFDEAGFDIGTVALWAAVASALSLPGRWIAPMLATRFRAADVQAAATLVLAAGTALMLDGRSTWQMIGHFALFGLVFGAVLPLRAMTMATWFSGPRYGVTMGSQWTVTTIVGATGPAVVGLLRDNSADYQSAVLVLLIALVVGAALLAGAARTPAPAHSLQS
jgi:MFS family permease